MARHPAGPATALEVIGVARRNSAPSVPVETPAGVGTVLPGVPLPSWALPAEPVVPEPPAPEPVPEPVPVPAAAYAASTSAPEPWPVPAPEPWPTAPVGSAPVAPVPTLEPLAGLEAPAPTAAPLDLPIPVLDAPAPTAQPLPLPAPDALAPQAPEPPAPHRHVRDDVVPEAPVRRRRFGRKPAADDLAAPAPSVEAAPVEAGPVPAARVAAAPAAVVAPPVDVVAEGEASHRSRRPLVLLLLLGVVAVLGAVAAFVWPGLLVTPSDEDLGGPVKPVTTNAKPAAVTLQTPATAGALQKVDGPLAQQLAAATGATTLAGLTAPVSAVYGTAGTPVATVVAWTATTPPSATAVTDAFAGYVVAHGVPVSGIVDVKAGPLGGQMRCGSTTVSGSPATVCFWADPATLGTVTVLAPATPQAGADTAAALRQAVETTG